MVSRVGFEPTSCWLKPTALPTKLTTQNVGLRNQLNLKPTKEIILYYYLLSI